MVDFGLFKTAYDEANGAGALAGLVPEPSGLMLSLAALGALRWRAGARRRYSDSSDSTS